MTIGALIKRLQGLDIDPDTEIIICPKAEFEKATEDNPSSFVQIEEVVLGVDYGTCDDIVAILTDGGKK